MLSFESWTFALIGSIAALAPLTIHRVARRRHRVLGWAAMELLQRALKRGRRRVELRDALLLVLRTLAVLLFAFAMARPFRSRGPAGAASDQAVHAVILIDNSLSMGYRTLQGTLLETAKAKARDAVERLPRGSRVSVLPLCGAAEPGPVRGFRSLEDAVNAIESIGLADRAPSLARALDLAIAGLSPEDAPLARRALLLSDQQQGLWPAESLSERLDKLPPLEVIQVRAAGASAVDPAENTWVSDFRIAGGFAEPDSDQGAAAATATATVTFIAEIRRRGSGPRLGIEALLSVNGAAVASRLVDLHPDRPEELRFTCRLELPAAGAGRTLAAASLELSPDRLPQDDRRFLVFPILWTLPVGFVDAAGTSDDRLGSRVGETFHLRKLLGPRTALHCRLDELDRRVLQGLRLLVLAGIRSPDAAAGPIRDFVERGGQLVIAAGADFDPRAWSDGAWLDGAGILPAPLEENRIGSPAGAAGAAAAPLRLDPASLDPQIFSGDGLEAGDLAALCAQAYFFAAVACGRPEDRLELAPPPRALAGFAGGLPFIVERRIGSGRTVFIASGVYSDWNNLTRTSAVLLVDRLLRDALRRALPERTIAAADRATLPIDTAERHLRFALRRPSGAVEPLAVEALDAERLGVSIRGLNERGIYSIDAGVPDGAGAGAAGGAWSVALAVNGPEVESAPVYSRDDAIRARPDAGRLVFLDADSTTPSADLAGEGQGLWKWLMSGALLCLLLELVVLRALSGGRAAPAPAWRAQPRGGIAP
jgi:hypothetical protein